MWPSLELLETEMCMCKRCIAAGQSLMKNISKHFAVATLSKENLACIGLSYCKGYCCVFSSLSIPYSLLVARVVCRTESELNAAVCARHLEEVAATNSSSRWLSWVSTAFGGIWLDRFLPPAFRFITFILQWYDIVEKASLSPELVSVEPIRFHVSDFVVCFLLPRKSNGVDFRWTGQYV